MRNKQGVEIMNETTINFIKLLRENSKNNIRMKSAEIAEILGISQRSVRRHRELAQKFGYKVEIYLGKDPGMEIIEERLTNIEIEMIENRLGKELLNKIKRICERV